MGIATLFARETAKAAVFGLELARRTSLTELMKKGELAFESRRYSH